MCASAIDRACEEWHPSSPRRRGWAAAQKIHLFSILLGDADEEASPGLRTTLPSLSRSKGSPVPGLTQLLIPGTFSSLFHPLSLSVTFPPPVPHLYRHVAARDDDRARGCNADRASPVPGGAAALLRAAVWCSGKVVRKIWAGDIGNMRLWTGRPRSRFFPTSLILLGILGHRDGSCLSSRRGSLSPHAQIAPPAEQHMQIWGCGVCLLSMYGFKDSNELSWPRFHRSAIAFRQHFGHCRIPDEGGVLDRWIEAQKRKR